MPGRKPDTNWIFLDVQPTKAHYVKLVLSCLMEHSVLGMIHYFSLKIAMLRLFIQIIKVTAVAMAAAVTATHFLLTPLPELTKYLIATAVALVLLTEMYTYASGRFREE